MKIGYDAKRFFNNQSGLGNYSRDLIRILNEFYPENNYYLYAKKETSLGNLTNNSKSIFFKSLKKTFASRQLNMGIQSELDGCHIFHGLSGEIPLFWKNKKIRKVVTIHDLIFIRYPNFYSFFDRIIHFYKFKYAVKNADLVIAISEQTKTDVINFLKIPAEKIQVIYQGCNNIFKQEPDKELLEKVKEKFNLPAKFILNVGTIEERKNLLNIVKAINNTSIPLVVVGKKTNYFKTILSYIKINGLENQVLFLENVNTIELASIYRMASIFVYPSLFEGFGIPILEAIFCKTPVITTNYGCFKEAGGEHSVYVDPLNVQELQENIINLWENESKRKEIIEGAFLYAQRFNDKEISAEIIKVYSLLLQ
ncbi:MAG: glycosyltransferase family 4 protein [Solirubrobacteraceae bacterium]